MGELIYLVTCLKKIWDPEMRKAWMDYCLINTSRRANKFFADDWFGETIIKENKDKVKPSVNATSDEFLRKTVALNIISLAKTREVMARESGATNHGNHHSAVNNTVDVSKLVQLLVEDGVFEEQLGRKCEAETSDLFALGTAKMATGIPLHKYQMRTRGNWNKAPPDSDQESDEGNETDLDTDDEDM